VDHGATPRRAARRSSAAPVGAAALGVLVGVRHLVARYAERGHAALASHRLGQAQRLGLSVVVVGEEAGDDFDDDTLQPVGVQQGAGGVGARDAGMIRDRAVAPEDRPDPPWTARPRANGTSRRSQIAALTGGH
jgi:hypothetical protein